MLRMGLVLEWGITLGGLRELTSQLCKLPLCFDALLNIIVRDVPDSNFPNLAGARYSNLAGAGFENQRKITPEPK